MSDLLGKAARLADPWAKSSDALVQPDELGAIAALLVRQKVSLLGLAERLGAAAESPDVVGILDADRRRYESQREEFERVRTAFTDAGVPTMLFKSTGLYPSFHYLSDNLDVLVPDGLGGTGRRTLTSLGYIELLNVEEPKKFLFRRFTGDGGSFAFHLHEAVGWGVPFLDAEAVWANARPAADDPDITIPGPVDALLITLAHWFYEDKSLSLGNLFLTANAVRDARESLEEAAGRAAERGWEEGFWAAVHIHDTAWRQLMGTRLWDDGQRAIIDAHLDRHRFVREALVPAVHYGGESAAQVPFALNKAVYYRKILRDRRRSAFRKLEDVVATVLWAVRWKLHVRSQRPVLITLSGCDGSGKTLQAEKLARVLDTCDIRHKRVWKRGASSRFMSLFIKPAKALFRRGAGSGGAGGGGAPAADAPTEAEKTQSRRTALRNPVLRAVFAWLYAVDLKMTYVLKTRLYLWTGNVVVCDRYFYDGMVDFAQMAGTTVDELPRILRWMERFAPRPTVGFVLDVDPEEALRRKPEEGSAALIAAARGAFGALAERRGLIVVSGDQPVDDIHRAIARKSLETFYENYGTILNGMLYSNPSQMNPR